MDTPGANVFGTTHNTGAVVTQRTRYISQHPVSQTAALHSADNLIAPVWSNVSSTPWAAKAKLLSGGYGSPMHRTKISDDCPAFFFNPHKEYHYDFTATRPSFTRSMAHRSERGSEACFVLPGGESVLAATIKSKEMSNGKKGYKIYNDGKRGLLLNIPPSARELPPINWDSSRRGTARDVPRTAVGTERTASGRPATTKREGEMSRDQLQINAISGRHR